MKNNGNMLLIGLSILVGVIVLISFSFFVKKDDKVTLPIKFIEYADYQCSACSYYYPMVIKALEKYTDNQVDYEYRHYPLNSIHPYAYDAALAGEASKEQGKFEEFSALLYKKSYEYATNVITNDDFLSVENIMIYAASINIDTNKLTSDMQSEAVKARVEEDIAQGDEWGLSGTPTFIINGRQFKLQAVSKTLTTKEEVNDAIVKQFTDYIDSLIAKAE